MALWRERMTKYVIPTVLILAILSVAPSAYALGTCWRNDTGVDLTLAVQVCFSQPTHRSLPRGTKLCLSYAFCLDLKEVIDKKSGQPVDTPTDGDPCLGRYGPNSWGRTYAVTGGPFFDSLARFYCERQD